MTNTELTHSRGAYGPAEIVTGRGEVNTDKLFDLSAAFPATPKGLGFVPKSKKFHRVYNCAIGTFLVLLVLPLLAIISLILLIAQGRPIFYRGERVGQNGSRFGILKFRSLDDEIAKKVTADCVLAAGTGAETPMGLFLRETRLDELPQLLNVMLGDMNLCGPRPVRPAIMEKHAAEIPNYMERFAVKPGLIGPTQAMMFHGTSKAIRSRLNYRLAHTHVSYRKELALVITVAACVFARTIAKIGSLVAGVFNKNGRNAAMVLADKYDVRMETTDGRQLIVRAIDKEALRLEGQADAGALTEGRLEMTLLNGQKRYMDVVLTAERTGYSYEPKTELSRHTLSRYLFQQVVVPHHSEFIFVRMFAWLSPSKR